MKRSKHSLSHTRLATCDMGELVPIGVLEVLPGDTIQHATSMLVRVSPLNTPVMHPVDVRVHHWYVPNRILWDDWENFITGGPDGLNASTPPYISTGGSGFAVGSLGDYLGVPTGVANRDVSALPFRAYAKIWNEWYRDQDLETALTIDTTDGSDTTTNTALQNVCWEKDYFTTCRPWTQKGAEVSLPLGTSAWVKGIGKLNQATPDNLTVYESGGTTPTYSEAALFGTASDDVKWYGNMTAATGGYPNIYADLSTATAATINELREAIGIQRYEEARARYGSRFTEYLAYLGIKSSDARLQRPEYLGGGRQTLQFSEVLQTGVTTDGNVDGVGNLRGHGIGAMRSNRYRKFFEEHGWVISLLSVRPKTVYADHLPRHWSRQTKEDWWQKELQHIGQQEVLDREVYLGAASATSVFGYQDRYDEYRRQESGISGLFRSTLNTYHYARIFGSEPTLNSDFVSADPTMRVYQDEANDALYVMARHSIQARRLVAKKGYPGGF